MRYYCEYEVEGKWVVLFWTYNDKHAYGWLAAQDDVSRVREV